MSLYRKITSLVHTAIFIHQMPNVADIARFVRKNANIRSVDPVEIERIVHSVCTPYKKESHAKND